MVPLQGVAWKFPMTISTANSTWALAGRCWAWLSIFVLLAGCQSASSASSRDAAASGLDGARATPDVPVTTDGAGQVSRADGGVVTAAATFTPVAITADAQELSNPLRGQYRWLGVAPYPSTWTDNDS
jgi:hypothetical protein